MANVIFDGEHVQALYDERGGDILLVTFNEMNITANGKSYWCQGPAVSMGISCVGLMTKQKNWFPRSDMEKLRAIIEGITCRYKYKVGYGFSQGGYGNIKYSRLLEIMQSFVFSPQRTIDPAELVDPRFNPLYREHLHDGMAISAADIGGKVTMFADPGDVRDWLHCNAILKLGGDVDIIPIRHVGHASVQVVSSTLYFKRLLETVVMSDTDRRQALLDLVKKGKKQAPMYHVTLGETALRSGHLGWARSLYDMSRARGIDHLHVRRLGEMLSEAGLMTTAASVVGGRLAPSV